MREEANLYVSCRISYSLQGHYIYMKLFLIAEPFFTLLATLKAVGIANLSCALTMRIYD